MLVVELNRYAPFERGARNAEICKTGLYKVVDHFRLSRSGQEKVRIALVVFDKSVLVFAEL